MGKPSSYKLSKRSEHSLNSSSSNQKISAPMSNQKMDTIKRKTQNKTKNKIRHLFKKLKEHCETSYDTSQDVTVISCDNNNEQNDTVINENIPVNPGQKRKLSSTSIVSAKRRKSDSSLILIDDDVSTNVAPCPLASPSRKKTHIDCSTPINKSDSKTLENLIINNFQASKKDVSQNFNEDIINLTKEINRDSYLTIDLTADSEVNKTNNVVIDVDKTLDFTTQTPDCTLISVSNTSLSMSGDSEVTVLQNKINKKDNQMSKFARGISKLNSTEKGKLLEVIVQNIFSGCKMSNDVKNSLTKIKVIKTSQSQATETVQDTFIKEVILGETKSRNSIGSNIYHPSKDLKNKKGLRMIVIDGSNVAMEHTKGNMFSVKGLKICIDYFVRRGHVVKAFVPRFRCKYGKSSDPKLLDLLERQGLVVYTPSREIQGRICVPYDDRYIVQCAAEFDGVIVSGDNYRDLLQENPRWRFVIENRLLPFTWVDDMIMFPKDPMGRNGPTLEEFLRHPTNSGPAVVHIL